MTVRAKFMVTSVEKFVYGETVKMMPVSSNDPASENHKFWTATPSGRLELQIQNPDAFGTFEPGQEFYLDFVPVEVAASASA